jgi:hypothetical protein
MGRARDETEPGRPEERVLLRATVKRPEEGPKWRPLLRDSRWLRGDTNDREALRLPEGSGTDLGDHSSETLTISRLVGRACPMANLQVASSGKLLDLLNRVQTLDPRNEMLR